jgi:hypothetical protein
VTPAELLPAVPNSGEDIVVMPNGDLAWAYVSEAARNTAEPLPRDRRSGQLQVPPARRVTIARLRYCR